MTGKLIGLAGPAGSGKTTLAQSLCETLHSKFVRKPFAATLKNMMKAAGVPHANIYGDRKEEPLDMLGGRTARHAMQTLGTEWGRAQMHPDIWVSLWKADVEKVLENRNVIVDDVRFDNEARAVRDMGGVLVLVRRAGYLYDTSHASEEGLSVVEDFFLDNSNLIHGTGSLSYIVEQL